MSSPNPTDAQRAVLDRVGSLEREQSVLYAKQARARAEMSRLWGADQGVVLELAGTARIGQDRAGGQLCRGDQLVDNLPVALGLLELGVMRVGTVQILLALTKNCSQQVQRMLDARLSERICPMDAADARALIKASIPELEAELDADAQRERHERARANRGMWSFPVEDGMARIGAEVTQVEARRFCLDFEDLVRAQKVIDDRDGVERTQAQRRADVFAQLPSRVLALADAATRGRLDALLAEVTAERAAGASGSAAVATPDPDPACTDDPSSTDAPAGVVDADAAPADAVDVDAAGAEVPSLPVPGPAADAGTAGDLSVPCGVQLGMDELPLGLPPAPPRQWWELDRDELLVGMLRLPVRNPVVMNVHIGMSTLLDLDQRSGWLEGFGPVPALHGRMLLPSATLRRVGVDERTGIPLGLDPPSGPEPPWQGELDLAPGVQHVPRQRDPVAISAAVAQRHRVLALLGPMYLTDRAEPQHDPSTGLRALARLRDQRCDGPGCPRTASACELDHEDAYAEGGQTALWNLKHRSTRCHICKHHGWTVEHDHDTGVSTWTSPAGSVFERLSPWQPPPALHEDLELPDPRLDLPLDLAPDRHDTEVERPLWREPEPPKPRAPRRPRAIDPDDIDEDGTWIPPKPRRDPGPSGGWDDGPPPF